MTVALLALGVAGLVVGLALFPRYARFEQDREDHTAHSHQGDHPC